MSDAYADYRRAQAREQMRRFRENNRERWLAGCREAQRRYRERHPGRSTENQRRFRERKLMREWHAAARAYLAWLDAKK